MYFYKQTHSKGDSMFCAHVLSITFFATELTLAKINFLRKG